MCSRNWQKLTADINMTMQSTIERKLSQEFEIEFLRVENESHMHNVAPGSESHFKVTIVSPGFDGQMLIKRHRMVNNALQQELQQIHALALHTMTPQEWQERGGQVASSPKCRGGGKNQ
jgi:BolA protein